MAYSNEIRAVTLEANADLSSHQFKIVEMLSTGLCDISDLRAGFGVLQNIPEANEAATVALDGETKARAGGTVAIGDNIHCVASGGWAGAVTSGTLTPVNVLGVAMSGAASGDIFTMTMQRFNIPSVTSGSVITEPNA